MSPNAPGIAFKKLLVPVDFSDVSALAVRHGVSLARAYGADLLVVSVADDESEWVVSLEDRSKVTDRWREERTKEGLRLLAEFCQPLVGSASYRTALRLGDPADEILACCLEEEADLLIMGTHGSRGVVSDWLGGVAYKLSKAAPCPVLMVRPPAAAAPSRR